MASNTRSKKHSIARSLMSSDEITEAPGLTGMVPAGIYSNLDKLSLYLGLGTAAAVKGWMQSAAFKPHFDELYQSWLKPQQELASTQNKSRKQGPQLPLVQAALTNGELHGDEKYSGYHISKEGWSEIDHYALCLYRLRKANTDHRDGAFRNTSMSVAEMESRLWNAMLRATYDSAKSRQDRRKSGEGTSADAQGGQGASQPSDGSSPHKKLKLSIDESTRPSIASRIENASTPRVRENLGQASTADPRARFGQASTRGLQSRFDSQLSGPQNSEEILLKGMSLHSPKGSVHSPQGLQHHAPSDLLHNDEEMLDVNSLENELDVKEMDDYERMRSERNSADPLDCNTDFGKYLTVHAVVKHFNDPFEIQRLSVTNAPSSPLPAANIAADQTRLWHNELESIAKRQRFVLQAPTADELSKQTALEQYFNNPKFQRLNYGEACSYLNIVDPSRPQFVGMSTTMVFKSWQVPGIFALLQFERDPDIRAGILADATGLGKTIQILGYWYKRLIIRETKKQRYDEQYEAREAALADQEELEAQPDYEPGITRDFRIPLEPERLPPAKPLLLIILPELIEQWAHEIRRFSSKFRPVIYHGDKRSQGAIPKVDGLLSKASPYFNGDDKNGRVIIITSLGTLVARHGPGKLKSFRVDKKGWSSQAAKDSLLDADPEWESDLSNCFDIITIDEAHTIKNPESQAHATIAWLNASFHILATASVLPNGIQDWDGFMKFVDIGRNLWSDENLARWNVTKNVNPFELADNHPAAKLRLTSKAVEAFITGETAKKAKSGFYLQKIWTKCLIRRTYASADPLDASKTIGEALPKLRTRRIICRFTEKEQAEYEKFAATPQRKLAHILENGKLVWNRKYSRMLILLSTWIGYHYIGDFVHAETIGEWKALPNLLYAWVKLLHKKQVEQCGGAEFDMPTQKDVLGQLAVVCKGAPKLRHTLRIIAELVVLLKRKIIIWCSIPANQILLHACLSALKISHATYTSELQQSERAALVNSFTTDPSSCYVFIGGFNVGSVGLNLQLLCNHALDFDCAPNKGAQDQAIGRLRRLNQPHSVERFELSVYGSFQDRQIQNSIMKAIPGAMAELTLNVNEEEDTMGDDGEKVFTIGDWYLIENELVQAPDPRVFGLPATQKLSPSEVVGAILDSQRGQREEMDKQIVWVAEDLEIEYETELDLLQIAESDRIFR